MRYSLVFFNHMVESEILEWPRGIQASFARIAQRMAEFGPNLGLPYTRAMGEGLFEIRARGAEGIGRAFFCTLAGQRIVVLHGFVKKTDKTPMRELAVAKQRQREVQNGKT
ncbi:MAG: hypothetical protein A2V79_01420 [Betaproteobacteria bacterium RBG_16_56_24]|nr:MAG: hypothetical protein A2V79_01420 [Betaproteobacteria bacterium RBG_16_56_24]